MGNIKNDAELYAEIGNAVNISVSNVIDKALNEFKSVIEDQVYNQEFPVEYHRTYQFLDSWESEVKKTLFGAEGEIGQNLATMLFNPEMYQHGSEESGDVSDKMASILFEGKSGNYFGGGWWQEPRDAWLIFITDITRNGKIFEWFRSEMRKFGISLTKI